MMTAKETTLTVTAPKLLVAALRVRGVAPYVQHAFPAKAKAQIKAKQEAGDKAKGKKAREAKDFRACYEQSIHRFADGAPGIPAPAFRNAMISACRTIGVVMTRAKLAVFVEADGFDANDGTPLIRFAKGEPEYHESAVRLATGVVDICARPMWREGWEAEVRVRFDSDMLALEDVTNLLVRAGLQVGIGEGRPDSKQSCGLGWGLFEVCGKE